MKLNKEWHRANKMPRNPTLEQRMEWHIEHAKNCHCREMPEAIKRQIKNFKVLSNRVRRENGLS